MNWVSAKERLPGDGERVIVYTPYDFFGDAHACIGDRESIKSCTTSRGGRKLPVFTHWMPLPRGPELR